MFAPLFAQVSAGKGDESVFAKIDSSLTMAASFLDEIAKDTPWLTETQIAGIPLNRILIAGMAILAFLMVGKVVCFGFNRAASEAEKKEQQALSVGLAAVAKSCGVIAFALGISVSLTLLGLSEEQNDLKSQIRGVVMTLAIATLLYHLVDVVDQWLRSFSSRTRSRLDDMLAPLVTKSLRAMLIILAMVHLITVVSAQTPASILAGLGVGGLAIGLAGQDTIKNIFGSLMIFSDRPFELGDEISIDGSSGVVETVGFRSTRYRTGSGHVITIPNGDLANKPITNISRRRNLSRTMNLQLPADLPPPKVEEALEICRHVLDNHEGQLPSQPAKVTFTDITSAALVVQVQYWFHPPDGNRFAALNERVNMELLRAFHAAQIPLATPRQKIELEKAA